MRNQVDLMPSPKNNIRTIYCSSVENDKGEGRFWFDHVDMNVYNDENGEDDSRIGFLDNVDEMMEELNSYTVAQFKVKFSEQGLIQTGKNLT